MGSIRKKEATGRWEARYRDPTGKARSRSFDRRTDAKAFLSAVEADMRRGSWQDPTLAARRFEEVAHEWLQSNPGKKRTTYARDAAAIRVHLSPVLGNLRIGQVRPSDIQTTVERMRTRCLGSRAIRTNYGVLRAILNWAVNTDIIDRSPCRGVRLPALTAVKKPVVSADDVLRLADAIAPDYRVTVFLGALGLRQAEVFGLRVGSINFLRRTITVEATVNEVEGLIVEGEGKTPNSNRTFSAPQEVLDELAAHPGTDRSHEPRGSCASGARRRPRASDQLPLLGLHAGSHSNGPRRAHVPPPPPLGRSHDAGGRSSARSDPAPAWPRLDPHDC